MPYADPERRKAYQREYHAKWYPAHREQVVEKKRERRSDPDYLAKEREWGRAARERHKAEYAERRKERRRVRRLLDPEWARRARMSQARYRALRRKEKSRARQETSLAKRVELTMGKR